MVEIAKIPDSWFDSIGGKSIHHVAWYELDRGPVTTKRVMDIVTDDGYVYRWSRMRAGETWTFEFSENDASERDQTKRRLPGKVETLVERSDVLYK